MELSILEYAPAVRIGFEFAFNNYNRNTLTRRHVNCLVHAVVVLLRLEYQIRSKNVLRVTLPSCKQALKRKVTKYNLHRMLCWHLS